MNAVDLQTTARARRDLCSRIKRMIVTQLDLPLKPEWITDDTPLFGRGLGLDSIDAMELVVGIEYEFQLAIDDEQLYVYRSVNSIADFIEALDVGTAEDSP